MIDAKVQLWRYVLKPEKGAGWGIFLLDSSGMFAVVSDYGNYVYKWTDWGPGDFRAFLTSLDKSYLCGKLMMDRKREYQGTATLQNIREGICQKRREGGITKVVARTEWNLASQVDNGYSEAFADWLRETKMGDDSYEYAVYDHPAQVRHFYDRVFKRFKGTLKKDLDTNEHASNRPDHH